MVVLWCLASRAELSRRESGQMGRRLGQAQVRRVGEVPCHGEGWRKNSGEELSWLEGEWEREKRAGGMTTSAQSSDGGLASRGGSKSAD